jgi:hypothetical protein
VQRLYAIMPSCQTHFMLEQKHHPHILIFIASIAVIAMLFFDRIP